jgi:hypothetical protein
MIRSVVDGVVAVLIAALVGLGIAFGLGFVGLTDTPWWRLGPWLAGMGLGGTWQQDINSTVGAGWTVTASGVPLLVTGVVALFVALRSRQWHGAAFAAAGAAGAAAVLVLVSRESFTTTNAAGSVTTTQGLTWWTALGAAVLVAVVWLLHTVGRSWWRSGRAVAMGLLVWLGAVLTAGVCAGLIYLTSSTAVGAAAALLYPLAGTLLLFGAGGAPVTASLTRLTPEPLVVATWDEDVLYAVGGGVAVIVLSAVVGLILRLVKHRSTWLGALTVTPLLAAFLAWAMGSRVLVPEAFGAASQVSVNPVFAAGVGVVLAAVARFCAGSPRTAPTPAETMTADPVEALLAEVDQKRVA